MSEIYLAGGCFWGTEKYISLIRGVIATQVGYANGNTENPTYEDVCYQDSGHAETVHVVYDPKIISLDYLLDLFYESIDPISVNRQGGDFGTQYRTGIYYINTDDLPIIKNSLKSLQTRYDKPIAIEVEPLINYTPAEEYHQKYLDKNPGGYCHIPKSKFDLAAKSIIDPTAYQKPNIDELRKTLTATQYEVTQNDATEPPFKNEFWNNLESGIYVDITTGEPLFTSNDKFQSGCGWPNFSKPIEPNLIREKQDRSHGMSRIEVRSRIGNAHLGHVFDDGPEETGGLRYCINSASLKFIRKDDMEREGYGYLLDLID